MRVRRLAVVLAACLAVVAAAVPAWGGVQTPTINPTSGPPGTVIFVAGTGCGILPGDTTMLLNLLNAEGNAVATNTVPNGLLGSWAGTLTVPADAVPGTVYDVAVFCGPEGLEYPNVPFTVTGPAPPPPAGPTPLPTPIPAPPRFTG